MGSIMLKGFPIDASIAAPIAKNTIGDIESLTWQKTI